MVFFPPFKIVGNPGQFLFIEPGISQIYGTKIVSTDPDTPLEIKMSVDLPDGWRTVPRGGVTLRLEPGKEGIASLKIVSPKDAGVGESFEITPNFICRSRSFPVGTAIVKVVRTTPGFKDDFTEVSQWKPIVYAPGKGKITTDGEIASIKAEDDEATWGGMEREVCLNLVKFPYLSIKISNVEEEWALKVDDDITVSMGEPGIRMGGYLNNSESGTFTYDLRKISGISKWNIRSFKIQILSIGKNKSVDVDWIKITSEHSEK